MFLTPLKNTFLFLFLPLISCGSESSKNKIQAQQPYLTEITTAPPKTELKIGAAQTAAYLPLLLEKSVAIVGNQTSLIPRLSKHETTPKYRHLVDSLLAHQVQIVKVFAPEHGFRGKVDAGETVLDGKDTRTGLPIISLYGKNKKPSAAMLADIDIVVFDIQDVGVRFYTYISTLHLVMQACAENDIPLLVLDRPNPNGHYIDGPTLDLKHQSFVGMHPIPLVHGMTIGEYAKMTNGEGWLGQGLQCELTIIPLLNYNHQTAYHIPTRPSPNLPNATAINLYPSLGLFEGTTINAGRGTDAQFQRFGSPYLPEQIYPLRYVPKPNEGAKHPKAEGQICYGLDLKDSPKMSSVDLRWLVEAYQNSTKKDEFFKTEAFTIHAGSTTLQRQITQGMQAQEIRATWQKDLDNFREIRKKYLLYD